MKKGVFLWMFLYPLFSHAIAPTVEATQIVDKVYQQLSMIAQNPGNVTVAGNARENFLKYFPARDFMIPDEFKYMESGDRESVGLITTRYVGSFDKFVQEKPKFTYSYRIGSVQEIESFDFSNKDLDINFVEVLVEKKYSFSDTRGTFSFTDTLIVGIDSKKIVKFENIARHKVGIQNGNTFSTMIETMKAEAAKLAKQGRYKESYNLYLKIVSKATDGDSYYRLAALIYDKDARRAIGIKKWREPVMQYLHKAVEYGQGKISYKAHNWINWLS